MPTTLCITGEIVMENRLEYSSDLLQILHFVTVPNLSRRIDTLRYHRVWVA